MRIGFFTDRYYPQVDGVAVSVELFARELRRLGHEVFIFCPGAPGKNRRETRNIVRFRSFPSIWYEDYRDTMPFTPAIVRRVRSYNLDLVHIHTPAQMGILGLRIAREDHLPTVITHHTDIESYIKIYKRALAGIIIAALWAPVFIKSRGLYSDTLSALKPGRPIRHWNRKVVREGLTSFYDMCDQIIAPSVKMAEQLKSYHVNSPIDILPTGIDPEEARLHTSFEPRQQYGIDTDAPVVLFVGRLGEEKNIQLLLRAFAHNVKAMPQSRLLIVGDGPYYGQLESLSEDLGIDQLTTFTGSLGRAETFACFRAANVFAFPSLTDTQGLVINEAAYSKKPIVFCDPEISPLTIDGKTGLLAKATVHDLANKIGKLIHNPELAIKFGEQAHTEAKKITMSQQAKKLEHIYAQLI
ncbi:glycosyltransferase [Candidatus Saccharibacteria bacterium]|nr:glycosyltransferase [Candidatus Saccharibacteria bacterium]